MNIAITGEGIISAIGTDKASVLAALQVGRSGVGNMKHLPSIHTDLPVGEVPLSNEQMKAQLHLHTTAEVSRTTLMGIWAVGQALAEAHVEPQTGQRVWLISGTTVGGMDVTEQHFNQIAQGDERYFSGHDCGSCTDAIAEHFGLFSNTTTVSTACSSAANALLLGARLLQAGMADVVVAGGTEALSLFHLNGFNSLMILDKERCRPFDQTRAGLNLGEGAAYVVLETESHAKARGGKVHAYLTGWGNACDAYHQTASSPTGEGAYLAMQEALHTACLRAVDIDYVNAHGTGTPNNDLCESVALHRVFGNDEAMPLVSSTKAFTGHATSAAGAIESVICILAMQHQFVPQSLGFGQTDEACVVPTTVKRHVALHHVMCNSFGFGGNDTVLIFSQQPTASAVVHQLIDDDKVHEVARVTINSLDSLKAISQYVKPLEARRMGRIMKASFLASVEALQQAGIECPDAVITATAYGCTVNSEKILQQMQAEGEATVSPTLFMQSTHNTIGSNVAIRLHCHGYNTTYTQGKASLACAMRDARLLLREGKCRHVLVGWHDELTPLLRQLLGADAPFDTDFCSTAIVLTCGE